MSLMQMVIVESPSKRRRLFMVLQPSLLSVEDIVGEESLNGTWAARNRTSLICPQLTLTLSLLKKLLVTMKDGPLSTLRSFTGSCIVTLVCGEEQAWASPKMSLTVLSIKSPADGGSGSWRGSRALEELSVGVFMP